MKVRYKESAQPITRRKNRKPHFSTVSVAFKRYNDALSKADLLFDAFSVERMQAQIVAINNLRSKLKDLGMRSLIDRMDFDDAYRYPVKYADEPRAA